MTSPVAIGAVRPASCGHSSHAAIGGSALSYLVTRAQRAFVEGPWPARCQRLTGAVLIGLGLRLAFERR